MELCMLGRALEVEADVLSLLARTVAPMMLSLQPYSILLMPPTSGSLERRADQ